MRWVLGVNVFNIVMVLAVLSGAVLIVFAFVGYVIIEGKNKMTDRSRKRAVRLIFVGATLAIVPILISLVLTDLSVRSKIALGAGVLLLLMTGIVASTNSDSAGISRFGSLAAGVVLSIGFILGLIDQFSD